MEFNLVLANQFRRPILEGYDWVGLAMKIPLRAAPRTRVPPLFSLFVMNILPVLKSFHIVSPLLCCVLFPLLA